MFSFSFDFTGANSEFSIVSKQIREKKPLISVNES